MKLTNKIDIKLNKIYNHINRIENNEINILCHELLKDVKKDIELDFQDRWMIIEVLENHKLDNNFKKLLYNIRNYFI